MSAIYDISITIRPDMQVWKGYEKKKMYLTNDSNFETGTTHESRINLNVHTGTHLDAPLHIIDGGSTIESIPLERLVGPARVLDLTDVKYEIGRGDLERFAVQPGEWLLFKTRNSQRDELAEFDAEFVFLNASGAEYLAEIGINGIAIDALGIERNQAGYPSHKAFFNNNMLIVEGVRLGHVPAGNYTLVVAPLKLEGIDGAPARAFLIGN